MAGINSEKDLFKNYPAIYLSSYQGSLTSTTREISNLFDRANNIAIKKERTLTQNNFIPTILFDEMGLAEISPNNPLKIIHSKLDGKQKIGFIGISNWALDASKMNRGITLCIPEPDLNDLILTANSIAKDINEQIEEISIYREVIQNLAKSYYEYKKYLEKYYPEYYDIHGARDYYNLIKISVGRFKNNCGRSLESLAIESIERNFSGIELNKEQNNTTMTSSTKFKQIFLNFQNNAVENIYNYNIFSCIENNLKDNNRYFLLITDNTKNSSLIELILKMLHLNFTFIQGSKLKEDQTEDYVLKKAWSIISLMEKGETIVLKDLETLYPKFYDLFNKNLITIGNEQFARMVLDSNTNERHIVNKNFKCLVVLDKDELLKEDPPFLNRFEKHLISFKYLLNEYQNGLSNNLYQELVEMTSLLQKDKSPLLLNINKEEIRCLLLDLSLKNVPNNENINLLSEKIAPLFSQENILNISYSPKRKYFSQDNF